MQGRPGTLGDVQKMKNNFLKLAQKEAEKSKCVRSKVGAVLVKKGKVLTKGHNGPMKNGINCLKQGCIREKLNIPHGEKNDFCYGVCAEQNAIFECAKNGISCEGGEIYSTRQPCSVCVKAMMAAGIKKILFIEKRFDEFSNELLTTSGLEIVNLQTL